MDVMINRPLFTKQRTPKLIAACGAVCKFQYFTMDDTMAVIKCPGWKELVAIPKSVISFL